MARHGKFQLGLITTMYLCISHIGRLQRPPKQFFWHPHVIRRVCTEKQTICNFNIDVCSFRETFCNFRTLNKHTFSNNYLDFTQTSLNLVEFDWEGHLNFFQFSQTLGTLFQMNFVLFCTLFFHHHHHRKFFCLELPGSFFFFFFFNAFCDHWLRCSQ